MEHKWLWVGGAAVVLLFLFLRRGSGGPQVIPAPDTSGTDQARFNFASQGLQALSDLEAKVAGFNTEAAIARSQANAAIGVEQLRDAALTSQAQANANAQVVQARSRENTSVWDTLITTGGSLVGQWLNSGRQAPSLPRSGALPGGGGMAFSQPFFG